MIAEIRGSFLSVALVLAFAPVPVRAQDNSDCLDCHADRDMTVKHEGRTVSLYVADKALGASIHGGMPCVSCHAALKGTDLPHATPVAAVVCGSCHAEEQKQYVTSLHGKAAGRGDPLAPRCWSCHGSHDISAVKDSRSAVAPLKIPFLCGRCHQENSPVMRQLDIKDDRILENYSESIHGEGLLKKGLIVAPSCASCHGAHRILAPNDPASSIARRNIATTCTKCHAQIEQVHRKIIRGELWEKQAHVLPACTDCHPPHKIRKVAYDQGSADADCLRCHQSPDLKSKDGRSMFVSVDTLGGSRHLRIPCTQCHTEVDVAHTRPCDAVTRPVDCTSCHAEIGQLFATSTHGQLLSRGDPNAPTCKECHGRHEVKGKLNSASATFPTNVPNLCARCHREGERAAMRYQGPERTIIESYVESIHGKGLLKGGLTVTATCTSCHTPHHVLPRTDPASSVNRANVPATCGTCHHGVQETFEQSIHSTLANKTDKPLPVCNDCHTSHQITRADAEGFMLEIMNKCGRCHEDVAKSYFDTYHGKVSQLGYTKTAKCYDCHGAHDIQRVEDPRSHLSRANVVQTCQKCHAGATRRFAGYLTHATHHDPKKYPILFVVFWAMTLLLLGTLVVGGLHTLLWIPRSLAWRREVKEALAAEERSAAAAAAGKTPGGESVK